MKEERFSRRFGHGPNEREITIREDAPDEVRGAILQIAKAEIKLTPEDLRDILCTVLRQLPNQSNWSSYPNIWDECRNLIEGCPWYRVYDFVEALYRNLEESDKFEGATQWQDLINEYFFEAGVGWRMVNGLLETRGPEAFASLVDAARENLEQAGLPTARKEIHEALLDLSRRPDSDLTGAISHAMGALECTAREVSKNAQATLGEILKRYPDLFPKPLDEALTKLWGYASEKARHVREGQAPTRLEAELIVGTASLCCTYLAAKIHDVQ